VSALNQPGQIEDDGLRRLPEPHRVEGFSDGAFSIIITLLVLEIHRPSAAPGRLGRHCIPDSISDRSVGGRVPNRRHHGPANCRGALLLDSRTDVGGLVACLFSPPPSSGAGEAVFAADAILPRKYSGRGSVSCSTL
jgi:hypothetical protein